MKPNYWRFLKNKRTFKILEELQGKDVWWLMIVGRLNTIDKVNSFLQTTMRSSKGRLLDNRLHSVSEDLKALEQDFNQLDAEFLNKYGEL